MYKRLIFVLFFQNAIQFFWFNARVTAYGKYLLSFLLTDLLLNFCFLFNQKNLYTSNDDLDLFYDICSTINEHSQR